MHDDLLAADPGPDPARRARILGHLERLGPGPRATYATLCALLDTPEPLPAASMLMHHMIRELESALREVMREPKSAAEPAVTGPGSAEPRRRQALAMIAGLELGPGADGEQRRRQILDLVEGLELEPAKEQQKAEIKQITAALGVEPEVVAAWMALAGKSQGWAHRRNLDAPEAFDREVRERIDRLEWVFDEILDAHAARFAQFVHDRLLGLLATAAPTKQDALRLRTQFPQDALTQQGFFDAAGREWLIPLQRAKMFANPPALADAGDGYVTFPWWPPTVYLVRMAQLVRLEPDLDPEQAKARTADQVTIAEIALGIPASANPRIGMDLAHVAELLAPACAARLAGSLAAALGNRHVIGAEHYAAAAVAMAEGGRPGAAATVLRALLALPTDEAGTWIGDWEYGEVLRQHAPVLADAMGVQALELFASLLTQAAGADRGVPSVATVEGANSSEAQFEPETGLVASVRDTAVRLVDAGIPAGQVLDLLPGEPAGIFARIRLHLLGLEQFAAALPDQVRTALTDPGLLHTPATEPEALRLLAAHAETLTPDQRADLQAAIDAGPRADRWPNATAALRPQARTLLEARWRLEWYSAADAVLDEARRKALAGLRDQYGIAPFQRPPVEQMVDLTSRAVPTSSLAAANTARELVDHVATALAATTQGPNPLGALHTMFALGPQVADAVAAGAAQFSAEGTVLAQADPQVVAYALNGFARAVRAGAVLDWAGLEPLLSAAADARDTARLEAVRLLSAAAEYDALPVEAAGWAWKIIAAALGPDEQADPARDAAQRAEAVHTAAEFARWADRAGYEGSAVDALAGIDLRTLPDPVAVAVGAETWTLLALEHPAAAERLAELTPGTPGFTGYLRTEDPAAERRMLGAFRQALTTADLPEADHQRIGQRLLRLYFAGVIGLQSGGVAERWWRHERTAAETVRDLAALLAHSRLQAGPAGQAFTAYVDWRLAALAPPPGRLVSGPARTELMTLAPTVIRTAPTTDAVARLGRIVDAIGDLPADREMWQRLVEAARTEPGAVLGLLHAWSRRLTATSLAPGRRDEQIEAIWRAGLASGDPAQVELATHAINRAASVGFRRYLGLLPPDGSDQGAQP